MTPKALSAEELDHILVWVRDHGLAGPEEKLRTHIAALEADNAALREEFEERRAALLEAVEEEKALWSEKSARGALNGMKARIRCLPGLSSHPGAALLERHEKEVAALRAYVEAFVETAEAAVRNQETKGHGGQHVSFHGDFSCIQPSVTSRLRWWAREGREALAGKTSALLVRARNEGLGWAATEAIEHGHKIAKDGGFLGPWLRLAERIRSLMESEQ